MANKKDKQRVIVTGKSAVNKPVATSLPGMRKGSLVNGGTANKGPAIHALIISGIIVITWLCLKVSLSGLFTDWDDPGYIINDPLVKNISPAGIQNMFSFTTGAVMGNYHPLTILSYAIEYSYVRLDPWLYHFDSLLFHVICTVFVYWLVFLLSRRPLVAGITALLFGIHPMHVESVAWIAGRKDLLYGIFYLASCIVYIYGLRAAGLKKGLFYSGSMLLFVLSLLAKPVAVTLPLTLLLIDYFEGQFKWSVATNLFPVSENSKQRVSKKYDAAFSMLLTKIPFFALAAFFGIRSILDQKKFGALASLDVTFNPAERIALGSYALISYLYKAIVPAGLSCFYPYPSKSGGTLPLIYYIFPLLVLAIFFVVWRLARKNKVIVFGLLFFLVNIGLLLQFIPVGGAILADRYTYIPYIGLFFIAAPLLSESLKTYAGRPFAYVLISIATLYCFALAYYSSERCKAWYDTTTLWTSEINEHPDAPNAYNNLGFYYFNKFSGESDPAERKIYYDSAYNLLNNAIRLQPDFINPYISLGELQRASGDFVSAKRNYYKALSLQNDQQHANALLGLGIIYAINHNVDSAAFCFQTALKLQPYFPEAHSNYGNFLDMTGKSAASLAEYAIAIDQNPDLYAAYLNRGRELQRLSRCDEAFRDFETAMQVSPDNGEAYYARSYCYMQKGNKALALQDVQKALSLNFTQIDPNYYQMLKSK